MRIGATAEVEVVKKGVWTCERCEQNIRGKERGELGDDLNDILGGYR